MATTNTNLERLETILRELKEAVVVCDPNARILLYNSAAKRLFHDNEAIGLGQSLYTICTRAPIKHTLRMLKHRITAKDRFDQEDADARFVCATVDGKMLLYCHISQITSEGDQGYVFVFTFEDMTRQITEMGKRGYLLEKMIKDLRAPITNLNTAAENLKSYPHMEPKMRSIFEDILIRESVELTRRFETVVLESGKIANMQWPLFDVYSSDLIGCVTSRFTKEDGITVTMVGVPLWLHADSYSLMLALDCLVRFVRDTCQVSEIDIEALLGDRRVYIDLVWKGELIPQGEFDSMLEMTLPDTTAGMTVADVLERHDSETWSQKHRRYGYSLLRVPVPDSPKQWEVPQEPLPERPEFYDFSISEIRGELGEMANQPLASLNYVVFDTETTGLRPAEGDEILSITAVRIVNGRILSGERFERFIKPQQQIPENSLPFLEITDEMLRKESPADIVLPQFRAFVNNAVLVAHNSAFDMHFFRLMEDRSGVSFENPILDTLLLTLLVDKGRTDYTLDSISQWLGVDGLKGTTTMDDCFATSQVFIRLLDLLEKRGITTLSDLIEASDRLVEEKE